MSTNLEKKVSANGNDLSLASLWQASLAPITMPMAIILFQYNVLLGGYSALEGAINPLWTSAASALALYLLLALIVRNANKAALITVACIFVFFDLSIVLCAKKTFPSADVAQVGFYSIFVSLFWSLFALFAPRGGLPIWRRFVAFCCAFVLAVQVQVVVYRKANFTFVLWPRVHWQTITKEMAAASASASQKPDIYYIILDTMASQEVTERIYDYHDHTFDEFLKKRGFYVAEDAHSNYPMTMLSLSSSLNMMYLDKTSLLLDDNDYAYDVTRFLMQNARVPLFLKSYNYRFINIGSGLGNTNYMAQANINLRSSFWDENFVPVFGGTLLGWPNKFEWMRDYLRHVRLDCFAKLAEARFQPGPKFVFCHIILPHVPCLFAADGSPVPGTISYIQLAFERELFLGQILFVRKKVMEAVDAILSQPGPKPIIIIQGDHGSAQLPGMQGLAKTWKNALIRERFGILNAFYLPDHEDIGLYQTISPINSFRLIFNHYLHTKIPLEEDRQFAADMGHPFTFREVTNIIKNPNDDSNEAEPALEESPAGTHPLDGGMD